MTDYDAAVLAALPDGYWKCDEASGLTLFDSSPHAHNLVGTADFAEFYRIPGPNPTQIQYAIDMIDTGTDPTCGTTTVGSYGVGQPFTVEAWWGGVGAQVRRHIVLEKGFSTAESRPWWMLGVDSPSATALFWLRNVAGTDYKLVGRGALNDATYPAHGPFHHLVGTFDPTAHLATLYVDGLPNATMTVPDTGWGTSAQPMTTGIFNNDKALGWECALAIYPTLFTAAGVLDHFNTGMKGNAFYFSQLSGQLTSCESLLSQILQSVRKTY